MRNKESCAFSNVSTVLPQLNFSMPKYQCLTILKICKGTKHEGDQRWSWNPKFELWWLVTLFSIFIHCFFPNLSLVSFNRFCPCRMKSPRITPHPKLKWQKLSNSESAIYFFFHMSYCCKISLGIPKYRLLNLSCGLFLFVSEAVH